MCPSAPKGPRPVSPGQCLGRGEIDAMISSFLRRTVSPTAALLLLGVVLGALTRDLIRPTRGGSSGTSRADHTPSWPRVGVHLAADTASAYDPDWERPYPQYQPPGKILKPYPALKPYEFCPQDVSIFGGAAPSSYGSVDDVGTFE